MFIEDETFDTLNETLPTVSYNRRKGICGFFKHLFYTYNNVALILMALKFMTDGSQSMIIMTAVNIMNNLFIEPSQCQVFVAIVNIPFIPVFLYGMFAESVPIFNSRKKIYIIMMGILSMICLTFIIANPRTLDVNLFLIWLTINSFCMAFQNTIIDGIIVI